MPERVTLLTNGISRNPASESVSETGLFIVPGLLNVTAHGPNRFAELLLAVGEQFEVQIASWSEKKLGVTTLVMGDNVFRAVLLRGNPTPRAGVFAAKRPAAKKTQTDRPDRCRRPVPRRSQIDSIQIQRGLVVRPSGLCGLQVIESAGRGLPGRQTNGSGIVKRPLGAGMKFGPAWRHNGAHRRDAHRRT